MFYCFIHNWYSTEEPCPACHQTITTTVATSAEGTEEMVERAKEVMRNIPFRYTPAPQAQPEPVEDELIGLMIAHLRSFCKFSKYDGVYRSLREGAEELLVHYENKFKQSKHPSTQEGQGDVLFKTEDGKDVRDGDKIWWVAVKEDLKVGSVSV